MSQSKGSLPPGQMQFPVDPQGISEFLTDMKRQMSQIDGEIITMKADATSSLFKGFAKMLNAVYVEKEKQEKRVRHFEVLIEKIYQAHPDIKILMEPPKVAPAQQNVPEKSVPVEATPPGPATTPGDPPEEAPGPVTVEAKPVTQSPTESKVKTEAKPKKVTEEAKPKPKEEAPTPTSK